MLCSLSFLASLTLRQRGNRRFLFRVSVSQNPGGWLKCNQEFNHGNRTQQQCKILAESLLNVARDNGRCCVIFWCLCLVKVLFYHRSAVRFVFHPSFPILESHDYGAATTTERHNTSADKIRVIKAVYMTTGGGQ